MFTVKGSRTCRFGIRSFVYSRRRPFHPHRLRETVTRWMPVATNKATGSTEAPVDNKSPIAAVMRSKGFMWLSSGHATAYYWSHAGQHFEIRCMSELQLMCFALCLLHVAEERPHNGLLPGPRAAAA